MGRQPNRRATTAVSREELQQKNIESYKVVESAGNLDNKNNPRVNYSSPENFVTYGSAKEYYVSSIEGIYGQYPYDGSKNEKNEWTFNASGLDRYMFDNEYPRVNGNVAISSNGWGPTEAFHDGGKYALPENKEYITIFGGPNTDKAASNLASLFPSVGGTANIVDASENRESNLTICEDEGNTVEFWMKKDAFHAYGQQEVIFDMWASGSTYGTDYARFAIFLNNDSLLDPSCMGISYVSGSDEIVGTFENTTTSSIADSKWHHYAITVSPREGSATLFVDGKKSETISGDQITGTSTSGPLVATIGAYYATRPADTIGGVSGSSAGYFASTDSEIEELASPAGADTVWELDVSGALMPQTSPLGNPIWDIDTSGDIMPEGDTDSTPFPVAVPGWCKLSASLDEFRFWKTVRTETELGLNWKTQVYGGTNTDDANTTLGVYYKFNEGITGKANLDSNVLDYSGRISNGSWVGYSSGARSLTSAMVESGNAAKEFKDPIIYEQHPEVVSLKSTKSAEGLMYDQQNNASLYNSMPMWIREEDQGQQSILKLTQIMSSYLDSLQTSVSQVNEIKNLGYPSGSESPNIFAKRNAQNLGFDTGEFFVDATVLEKFMDRNDSGDLEYKLEDVKNLIYQNIYNNLTFIMSSKGTEKSFRNLSRCFGIPDDFLKLNIYSNNEEYTIEDKYANVAIRKNTIDFNDPTRFQATMFQTSSTSSPTRDFITESLAEEIRDLAGLTLEGDFIFPKKPPSYSPHYFDTPFTKSSVFGLRYTNGIDLTTPDGPDLSVNVIREERNGQSAYFQLTSSYMGLNMTSSVFGDVYDNTRWNLAVKLKNTSHNSVVSGDYVMEFQGVNSDGSRVDNSFSVSHDFPPGWPATAFTLLASNKRVYAGAMRTDTVGAVVNSSDVLVSNIRYWQKYLSDDTIRNHAVDATSCGVKDPNMPLFVADTLVPTPTAIETLTLDWDFQTVSSADASGEFFVPDISSGSAQLEELYGDLGSFHPGKGYGFPAESTVVNKEYINTLKRINPENSNGADMVKVLTPAEEIQQELSNPTNLVFSIEKSLYQTISDEMLKFFSTSADLASLYMRPSDKYNTQNRDLELMRNYFFEKMDNNPDVNKFYEYFKWIDDIVVQMLRQQLPAGAEVIDGSVNIIESHILERNKIKHKPPTYATSKSPIYEGSLRTPNTERTD